MRPLGRFARARNHVSLDRPHFTLMKQAGHPDLNTTMRYGHLNDDEVRAAIERAGEANGTISRATRRNRLSKSR
jgi:integrase